MSQKPPLESRTTQATGKEKVKKKYGKRSETRLSLTQWREIKILSMISYLTAMKKQIVG